MLIDNFLNNLINEIGFKFGTPWRYSDKALGVVVPILKIGDVEEREYITIEEAKDKGVTFKDSGHIDKVIIESMLNMPIFIRSGTILKSEGTQPRAVESSVVIISEKEKVGQKKKEEQVIPVRCIYASKGIHTGSTFTHGGDVPLEVRSSLLSRSGQGSTWAAVGHSTHRLMSTRLRNSSSHNCFGTVSYGSSGGETHHFSASRDNLAGIVEEVDKFTDDVNKILEKVPLFEDQVGAVFLDMKEVIGMELFNHPMSWEAIHKEVEKRLGESIAKEEDKTFFKPDYEQVKPLTLNFLKKLINSEKIETSKGRTADKLSEDIYSVTFLKGDGIVGEATSINGKVIHLVGIKVEKIPQENSGRQTSTSDLFRSIGGPRVGSYRPYSGNNPRTTF